MGNSRKAAVNALEKCRRADAWSDAVLGSIMDREELSGRDRALATQLCYGVMQNRLFLDYYINNYSSIPANKLQPKVLDILRISAYQIVFLRKIPVSAAVNEGVKLCRTFGFSKAAGLVNAVLRRISENKDMLPEIEGSELTKLSVRYSHPLWLTEKFCNKLGIDGCAKLLEANNAVPPVTIQVNLLKTNAESYENKLAEAEINYKKHPYLPDCFYIFESGAIINLPGFDSGEFYVQDAAAKLSVLSVSPAKGDRVLDVCSAPGGKSFAAAIVSGGAEIVSCDIHENKLKRIKDSACRLGIENLKTRCCDGREFQPEFEKAFDVVIVDAPCSGLGVIRKKPDIRFKSPEDIAGLSAIQLDILRNASQYVKPGGKLLYSTCTVMDEENSGVVTAFLSENNSFTTEDFCLPGNLRSENGMLTLWPHIHNSDGFFICKLRREK